MRYSSNGWSYVQLGDIISLADVIRHLNGCGIKGFDICVGTDSYPRILLNASLYDIYGIMETMEVAGSCAASIVLISFPLNDVEEMVRQLKIGTFLAKITGAPRLHLLPRKPDMRRSQAWKNLIEAWKEAGDVPKKFGLPVSVENHTSSEDPEKDIFLFRDSNDFTDLIDRLKGEVRIKYDPAWLLKAGDDPFAKLQELIGYIEVLDLKDYTGGKFVSPGEGDLDFERLIKAFKDNRIIMPDVCVEVEEHHFYDDTVLDINKIDSLIISSRKFYEKLFGNHYVL